MAKKYAVIIALILVVSYFSLTSGSFSVRPAELLSTLFRLIQIRSMKFCFSI